MKAHRKDINTAQRGVSLEHRHFSFIASVLRFAKPDVPYSADDDINQESWRFMVESFEVACRSTNGRFDRARFLAACGMED